MKRREFFISAHWPLSELRASSRRGAHTDGIPEWRSAPQSLSLPLTSRLIPPPEIMLHILGQMGQRYASQSDEDREWLWLDGRLGKSCSSPVGNVLIV